MVAFRPTQLRKKAAVSSKKARYIYVTRAGGKKLLDRQAKKYLGMSGPEFRRKYRAGEIEDCDRSEVIRVAMLLPFAEQ